jgi:hypothetical protein
VIVGQAGGAELPSAQVIRPWIAGASGEFAVMLSAACVNVVCFGGLNEFGTFDQPPTAGASGASASVCRWYCTPKLFASAGCPADRSSFQEETGEKGVNLRSCDGSP